MRYDKISFPAVALFIFLLFLPVVFSTIQYPSTDAFGKYIFVFYQTSTNTTLAADITRDDTTLNLTDATGFSTPGMLYFPDTKEIMHINSINGNTITVNRDPRYTAGSGRFAHSAGEVVVFAHFQYVTGSSSIKLFQDDARAGDFVLFGSYYGYEIMEGVNLTLTNVSVFTSAEVEGFELNYVAATSGDAEYYIHQMPIVVRDGTNVFSNNGVVSFENHESGLPYYYNDPINFYNKIYDESGTGVSAFYVGLRLKSVSGWTQGAVVASDNMTYYKKLFSPDGEDGLSWSKLAEADHTTPIPLADENGLFRQVVDYDDANVLLKADVSGFSSAGNLSLKGLHVDQDVYAYFPFVKGTGFVVKEFAKGNEFMEYYGYNIPYGYGAEDKVYWTSGQWGGKKALYINKSSVLYPTTYFNIYKSYSKLSKSFSVEMIVKLNTNGTLFTIGTTDLYHNSKAYPFRFLEYNNYLKAEVSTSAGNYYAYTTITTGSWHYIVATFDGNDLRLYVDGSLANTVAVSGDLLFNNPSYFLFGGQATATDYFDGAISEVVVWNKVLTASEISDRNTKQSSDYLLGVSENISVSGDGVYLSDNTYAYLSNVSYTGSYNFTLSQTRLNIMGFHNGIYTIYTDFGLKDSNFTDASNSHVVIGGSMGYNYRAVNLNYLGSGSFTLGQLVNGRGYNGGTLTIYNTNAQGTYRNYWKGSMYGGKIQLVAGSFQPQPPTSFVDVVFDSLNIGGGIVINMGTYATLILNTSNWRHVTLNDVSIRSIQYKPFYDENTLEVTPDEDLLVKTASETYALVGCYYIGGYHKGVTAYNEKSGGYGAYFYHYNWKEIIVNPSFESGTFNVVQRNTYYGSPTFGYTLKLKIVDENGEPVQGARVYLTDKDGYSAVFRPVGHAAQQYIYGSNYGGAATSLKVENGSKYSVGDVINMYGERAEVTAVTGDTLTITRAVQGTGDAYAMRFGGTDNNYDASWIEKQEPYLDTNASGEIPELIVYTDYYKNTTAWITKNPFTLKVLKNGYEPLTLTFNLTEPMELVKELHGRRGIHPINVKIVSGTEYAPNDTVDMQVKVTDAYGQTVDNATCVLDVYYPSKALWLNDIATTNLPGTGIYYNNSYTAPSTLGVYTYFANCSYDGFTTSDSKTFQIVNGTTTSGGTSSSQSSNTTYVCTDVNTLLKNTTYADGTHDYEYLKCSNGCHEGYCVNVSESKGLLDLNVLLLLILAGVVFFVGRMAKGNKTIEYSFMFLSFLIIGLTLFFIGVYGKSIPNPLFHFVGGISFNVSSLLLVFIGIATAGLLAVSWFRRKNDMWGEW